MNRRDLERLVLELKRQFDRFAAGDSLGRFKLVGPGDDARLAEVHDDARFLDHALNARSGICEIFVRVEPNQYTRKGFLVLDHSPSNNWGGNQALVLRRQLMQATAEALVLLSSASGHDCGLVLPGDTSPRLIQAGTCTQVVLAELAKSSAVDGSLDPQLKLLVNQARYVEFAILVLDVHKLGSPEVRSALTSISKHCELVIVEVSDPWDYQLPSLGKVRLRQNGEVKRVDTSDGNTREAYVAMAAERQRSNQEFLRGLGRDVQHHELITSIPFGTQFLSEFAPSPARRAS